MKSRYWSFIVYPESINQDWINILEEKGVVFCISPLHNMDYNPTGEKKKEHYHVLLEYEGPKTYKSVKEEICDEIGATIPKKIESLRGYYRYLTHKDNPEKAQYKEEEIKTYNGFKLDLTNTEITMIKNNVCEDIIKNKIIEYSELIDFYRNLGDYDYFEVVANHTYFFDKYITSRRHKNNKMVDKVKAN